MGQDVVDTPCEERLSARKTPDLFAHGVGEDNSQEGCAGGAAVCAEGLGFTAYWRRYRDCLRKAEADVAALCESTREVFGVGYSVGEKVHAYAPLERTRREITDALFARAEQQFAPQGGSLNIARHEVLDRLPGWGDDDDGFDPDALWRELERSYGGDAGRELGLTQTGCALVSAFSLTRRPPVRKANRLVLEDQIWTEKAFRGGHEMTYSTAESVMKVHLALATFCEWAGDPDTASRILSCGSALRHGRKVVSRERFNCGGAGYVMYLNKMVWEIYGDLADKFVVFISTYGRQALESER